MNTVVEACLWFCFSPKTRVQSSMCELVHYHGAKSMIGSFTILYVSDELIMQWAYNFNVAFHYGTTPLQTKKAVSKTFTIDRTWRALFGLGSSGRFHWDDWALVSM